MAWKEKSQEIALEILERIENGVLNSYTRADVLHALEEAAIKGMEYECDIAVMPLLNKLNKDKLDET